MSGDHGALPEAHFAFPGPLRDRLVAAVLAGTKTATAALLASYGSEGEPLPAVGARQAVVDSAGRRVAVIETTAVEVVPLAEVGEEHARAEGSASAAEWRAAHERFWGGAEVREELGDPEFAVTDATPVVLERFRVVARL